MHLWKNNGDLCWVCSVDPTFLIQFMSLYLINTNQKKIFTSVRESSRCLRNKSRNFGRPSFLPGPEASILGGAVRFLIKGGQLQAMLVIIIRRIYFCFDFAEVHGGGTSSCSTSDIWRGCKQLSWSKFISCKIIKD